LRLPYLGLFESIRFANACLQELNDIELYYERYSWMTYGGLLAARWKHIPWIAEYNGDPIRDLQAKNMAPTGIQKRLSEMITRWTLGTANAIVASGEGWKQNCIRYWKVKPHKTVVVENGTDLLGILTRDDLNVFRPLEEAREPVKFVYLGGFYPWHGIDKLLIAFKGALRSGVEAQLVLIGSGAGFGEARQLAQRLELDDRVEFTGSLDTGAYAKYLAEADIGVSPYCGWNEYSGLKIFDYKAAGLACIASGENGQPATLKHGETGWIVPPCDQAALEEAIIMLGRDLVLRRKLGQAARIDAEERNSWSYTAQQLENIFNEIVQR
jgi:glycosyltransferase involved in cell wall biosynthesis